MNLNRIVDAIVNELDVKKETVEELYYPMYNSYLGLGRSEAHASFMARTYTGNKLMKARYESGF